MLWNISKISLCFWGWKIEWTHFQSLKMIWKGLKLDLLQFWGPQKSIYSSFCGAFWPVLTTDPKSIITELSKSYCHVKGIKRQRKLKHIFKFLQYSLHYFVKWTKKSQSYIQIVVVFNIINQSLICQGSFKKRIASLSCLVQ